MHIEALLSPAELPPLARRDLTKTTCVVFDVLRATSTFVTALHHGAKAIVPVGDIAEALAFKASEPGTPHSEHVLLAGERDGLKIRAAQTGGTDFDLGNSPREFTQEKVSGKTIVATTTNGTRALRACAHAQRVLAGAFLNLRATAALIRREQPESLVLVCSGTLEEAALEDVLGAGALCDLLWHADAGGSRSDSAVMAHQLFQVAQHRLLETASQSRNARRLLAVSELKDDVAFCLQRDVFDAAAVMGMDGRITMLSIGGETQFEAAIRRFDEENSRDPNVEIVGGVLRPRELVYAERLTAWVLKLCPDASEPLRLAARCQHLCRWQSPRESYPMTRPGYLQWRADLKLFHARKSGEILREVGYPDSTVERVQALNLKKEFPRDAECRVLEDALCLVFLEHQLAELARKTAEDKVIAALQKSWKKMTPAAHAEALKLAYGPREEALLRRALEGA